MLNSNIYKGWRSILYITDKNYHTLLCPFSSRTGGKPIPIRSKPRVHLCRIYNIHLCNNLKMVCLWSIPLRMFMFKWVFTVHVRNFEHISESFVFLSVSHRKNSEFCPNGCVHTVHNRKKGPVEFCVVWNYSNGVYSAFNYIDCFRIK